MLATQPVVDASRPSFEVGEDLVDPRQDEVSGGLPDDMDIVAIGGDRSVAGPAVGFRDGVGIGGGFDEVSEVGGAVGGDFMAPTMSILPSWLRPCPPVGGTGCARGRGRQPSAAVRDAIAGCDGRTRDRRSRPASAFRSARRRRRHRPARSGWRDIDAISAWSIDPARRRRSPCQGVRRYQRPVHRPPLRRCSPRRRHRGGDRPFQPRRPRLRADRDPRARVFGGINGQSIGRRFAAAARAAGIEGVTAHSSRVGHASELTARGASTTEVMLSGGWKTARMVAHYSAGAKAERGAVAKYL